MIKFTFKDKAGAIKREIVDNSLKEAVYTLSHLTGHIPSSFKLIKEQEIEEHSMVFIKLNTFILHDMNDNQKENYNDYCKLINDPLIIKISLGVIQNWIQYPKSIVEDLLNKLNNNPSVLRAYTV